MSLQIAIRVLLAPVALLAGCVAPVQPPPDAVADPDACGASGLQDLVGQQAATLDRLRFAVPLRVIRPGMAVTMDYSAQRLNVELDAAGRIQRVYCG